MLSRVAEAVYWMGRYLERAEHLARLLDVHHGQFLDGVDRARARTFWAEFLSLTGAEPPGHAPRQAEAVELTVYSEDGPGSILACLSRAREDARGVREALSSELWEQLNAHYWWLRGPEAAQAWREDLHQFLQQVKYGLHLLHGLADETMSHDEGWAFLRLGKYFERAANTVDLVRCKWQREEGGSNGAGPDDAGRPVAWGAVLKCCSAFEAYRRFYAAPMEPHLVAQFLLFNTTFPRSVAFSLAQARDSLRQIDEQGSAVGPGERSSPVRLVGRLAAGFDFGDVVDLVHVDLGAFADRFAHEAQEIHYALNEAYFAVSRPARRRLPLVRPAQQQQQRAVAGRCCPTSGG